MARVNNVNASQPWILRYAGYQQTDTGMLWVPPNMRMRFESQSNFSDNRNGCTILNWELQNRSGGTASCGVGLRLANEAWIMGRLNAAGTTFTDLTSSAQSSTATVTLQVTGADQTGFVLGCKVPFDWVSVYITTAEDNAGGSTVADHAVYYSNAAGSDWTAVDSNSILTDDFTLTNTVWTAAVKEFVWQKPANWGKWTSTILPAGYWYLRFTSAHREASDVAAIATGIELGVGRFREGIADNSIYASETEQLYSEWGNGLVAYFSTANAGNLVSALVEQG